MKWLYDGGFTPYGYSYDVGRGTMQAIGRYKRNRKAQKCGGEEEWNNGNGSLMRILPACIYSSKKLRGGACGLYFFMTDQVLNAEGSLRERLQAGLARGFEFYEAFLADKDNLRLYDRLQDLDAFAAVPVERIKSSGYVVDTLEAAVWSLITTDAFEQALLKAVNLGDDTDTVSAVTGGLAGLYYGYDRIPGEWLAAIKKREWIEGLCEIA